MNRLTRALTGFALVLTLGACTAMGLPTAQTFDQKAVVAQGTVTQIRVTATQLLQVQAISVGDAENALASTDAAATGIAVARDMRALNPTGAMSKLTSVTLVLQAVQAYLLSKGPTP